MTDIADTFDRFQKALCLSPKALQHAQSRVVSPPTPLKYKSSSSTSLQLGASNTLDLAQASTARLSVKLPMLSSRYSPVALVTKISCPPLVLDAIFAYNCPVQVVEELSTLDTDSWIEVARAGSNTQVIAFLEANKLPQDVQRICWRLADADFFNQVVQLLKARGAYNDQIW
jgi:hypothetical protein